MTRREETAEASDTRRLAHLLFQVVDQIGFRRFQRRAEAEEHRCEQAKQKCRRKNGDVRAQLDDEREIDGSEQAVELLEHQPAQVIPAPAAV